MSTFKFIAVVFAVFFVGFAVMLPKKERAPAAQAVATQQQVKPSAADERALARAREDSARRYRAEQFRYRSQVAEDRFNDAVNDYKRSQGLVCLYLNFYAHLPTQLFHSSRSKMHS
jgi:hypothetical protein